ncbi:MAG: cupin domain-containing protein [Candidatus Zixiibacteriota bacterium]
MKVRNYHKVEKRDDPPREKSVGVGVRVAISVEDGATQLAMRVIEIEIGGLTSKHAESHDQAIFVTKGNGIVTDGKKECNLAADDVLFIPARQEHQIKNTGDTKLVLVSTIPILQQD